MSKRSTLVKKLDKVFSQFIRQRDANSKGICTCATCSKQLPIKEIHCGHFMSRRSMATRWHPLNCASQCPSCNTFNQGRQYEFSKYIDKRFGEGTAEMLCQLSKTTVKYSIPDLQEKYDHFKNLLTKL